MLGNKSPAGQNNNSSTLDGYGLGSALNMPGHSLPKGGGAIRGIGEKFVANRLQTVASCLHLFILKQKIQLSLFYKVQKARYQV